MSAYLHVFRYLTTYPLVILEASLYLRVLNLGEKEKGFGIFAQEDIVSGEIIFDIHRSLRSPYTN